MVDRGFPSPVYPHGDSPTRNALVRVAPGRALARTTPQRPIHQIYLSETGARLGLRLKWVLSTLIAGSVGLCIIGAVIYASTNMDEGDGVLPSLRHAMTNAMKPRASGHVIRDAPSTPAQKTDRTVISSKGMTTYQILQESVVERRGAREFITVKPYIRLSATLPTVKSERPENIPPFNPFELYTSESSGPTGAKGASAQHQGPAVDRRVEIRSSPLAGGGLEEDGQELAEAEIERLVAETEAVYAESYGPARQGGGAEGGEGEAQPGKTMAGDGKALVANALPPRTTIIEKRSDDEAADSEEEEDTEIRSETARHGDTIAGLIRRAGAEEWQANAIAEAMAGPVAASQKLKTGQELRFVLALAAANPAQRDPVRISLFTGDRHEGTVIRSGTGEYVHGGEPVDILGTTRSKAKGDSDDEPARATLYNSVYQAAQAQNLPAALILKLLRVYVYDVDYKARVQPGDSFDLFFDTKEESGGETPGELLFTGMTVGGEAYRYYRFRTSDGQVDYYNESGANAKKFLMHMPVKGGRFTSGFGFRRHPLFGVTKMHTGVDWAAPIGSPIMASGSGVLEAVGPENGYGRYIRIRHGNGYKTAYAHMSRFAEGMAKGVKVRQGQIIGYVGNSGNSSGPHLHYEVLVNNSRVNPLGISVPRGRQLSGRMLADFRKERSRIDSLMAHAPVKTRMAAIDQPRRP